MEIQIAQPDGIYFQMFTTRITNLDNLFFILTFYLLSPFDSFLFFSILFFYMLHKLVHYFFFTVTSYEPKFEPIQRVYGGRMGRNARSDNHNKQSFRIFIYFLFFYDSHPYSLFFFFYMYTNFFTTIEYSNNLKQCKPLHV